MSDRSVLNKFIAFPFSIQSIMAEENALSRDGSLSITLNAGSVREHRKFHTTIKDNNTLLRWFWFIVVVNAYCLLLIVYCLLLIVYSLLLLPLL